MENTYIVQFFTSIGIICYCVTFHPCVTLFIMNNEQSPIRHNHPWVGGGSWVGEHVGVADVIKG
jgi:hypothetical protein